MDRCVPYHSPLKAGPPTSSTHTLLGTCQTAKHHPSGADLSWGKALSSNRSCLQRTFPKAVTWRAPSAPSSCLVCFSFLSLDAGLLCPFSPACQDTSLGQSLASFQRYTRVSVLGPGRDCRDSPCHPHPHSR